MVRKHEARRDVQRGRRVSLMVAITVGPCESLVDPESGAWLSDGMP